MIQVFLWVWTEISAINKIAKKQWRAASGRKRKKKPPRKVTSDPSVDTVFLDIYNLLHTERTNDWEEHDTAKNIRGTFKH